MSIEAQQDDNQLPGEDGSARVRVACYRGDASACWYYRVHLPMSFLSKRADGYKISVYSYIQKQQVGSADVAIFQRQYIDKVLEFAKSIKSAGTRVIYEVDDDLFNVPDWNPAFKTFSKKPLQDTIKQFLSISDAVFVTTEELKGVYANYNENIYVLPNSLPINSDAFFKRPYNSAKKVVSWQGSNTHKNDLKLIESAVTRIHKESKYFVKLMTAKVGDIYSVPGVDFVSFYPMLSQLDIDVGLAPIIPNRFNRGKSNVKFLEYTVHDAATVASDFGPYAKSIINGENGILVSNSHDWYDAIIYLLENDDVRLKMVNNAKKLVDEKYDLNKNWELWYNAIETTLKGSIIHGNKHV